MGEAERYIEKIYEALGSEDLFLKAKVYSWQTFFHHSVSVALIAHYLGSVIKKNAPSLDKLAIESLERRFGLNYEELLLLASIAHDYVKLHGIEGRRGEENIKRVMDKLLEELFIPLSEELKEEMLSKLMQIASAVEGGSEPELEEELVKYVANVISIADELMSFGSIDEAIDYIQSSRKVMRLVEGFGLRFGFVKTALPSILHAKISESVIDALQGNGWRPLVIYADGVVLLGRSTSKTVALRDIVKAARVEVSSVFKLEERLEELLRGLKKKAISDIYRLLLQTRGKELLKAPIEEEMDKRSEKVRVGKYIYHNLIVKYLKGSASIADLDREIRSLKRGEEALLDPRTLATGIGKGSTYFVDKLGTIITSKEMLAEYVASREEEDRFLLLAYMLAFPSRDEDVTANVITKALGVAIPKTVDRELMRIVAIAEAFKRRNDIEGIKRMVSTIYEELGVSEDIDHYVMKFVETRLKSNVMDLESSRSFDVLSRSPSELRNYCRVCGEPILKASIRFIQYGQAVRGVGSVSEVWLHDDPPLASLEKLATDRDSCIRYICPLCYYESHQVGQEYRPPFLVVTLHPVVSYDLWGYVKGRLSCLSDIYELLERRYQDVAEIYREVLVKGLKVDEEVLRKITERSDLHEVAKRKGRRVTVLFDSLGARVILPLGSDFSLKKKEVAIALALAPFAMSLSGGGQVGLVSNLTRAHSLGSEAAPIVLPHLSYIVSSIVGAFERIRTHAARCGREMTPSEYSSYSKSYITLLTALYIYGLKVFGWYTRREDIKDYALSMHEYMTSIPYVPLSLSSPPPPSLDPREGGEGLLRHYGLISSKSLEVEGNMSQASSVVGGKEKSLNKLLYSYAVNLNELTPASDLSKYHVQRPLREGIEILLQYSRSIGEESAKDIAADKFLELVARSVGNGLENKKTIKDESGKVVEVTYRSVLFSIFSNIADVVLDLKRSMPASTLRRLIEVMLDSAFEKYRYVRAKGGG
ncbi:MAG: hypothetical protein N3F04_07365 [Candidatus Nezhaarchaeota archaeon]|nr:hypothetical protein [Candidatus Nezhaarchaeota archaeon]MCX8142563.1 hypothetical protein [Candidatus Nezhaarchaeota archaeon]